MKDQIVVITGGSGTIGRAVAAHVAEHGGTPVPVDRSPADSPYAFSLSGVDLTDAEQAEQAIAAVVERFGRIDGLVNVAGTFRFETIADGSVDTWDFLYQVNVRTALDASRAAIEPLAASRGSIVNVGAANAALPATAGLGAYAASKAAVIKLTEALADELKSRFVRVNAVLPSIVDTAPNRQAMPEADFDRWVTPEALADAIGFLLSPAARAVTGAALPVKGRI
ncbi:MAG: SDR family NAD(P)-dependent oxidoreductase [Myxococcota bacterium]